MNIIPMPGMVMVEELGPIEQALGKRLVVPDCGGYDPKNPRRWRERYRRMRGRVMECGVEASRSREAVGVPPVEVGAVVWYWEGVAKKYARWREEDGRVLAVIPTRELICEEVQ